MYEHTLTDQPLLVQCLPKLTVAQPLNYKRRLGRGVVCWKQRFIVLFILALYVSLM